LLRPSDEQSALRSIDTLVKSYEPQFELQHSFTAGVIGCSDPLYRPKWKPPPGWEGIIDLELDWQKYQPADSRLNWRVTVCHSDYFIHIMAIDEKFERFAISLQTKEGLEAGFNSDDPRPACLRYQVVNQLSELKPFFDEVYGIFKRDDEQRRERDKINKAVAEERQNLEKQLAEEREKRRRTV
jgi:hypothetical protein